MVRARTWSGAHQRVIATKAGWYLAGGGVPQSHSVTLCQLFRSVEAVVSLVGMVLRGGCGVARSLRESLWVSGGSTARDDREGDFL